MHSHILNKPWIPALGFGITLLLAAFISSQARAAGMPAETSAQANVSGTQDAMPAVGMQPMSYDAKNGASASTPSHDKAEKMKKEGAKKE